MPSINRSTFLTPVQRGVQPSGYDFMATGPNFQGHQGVVEFNNITGLQPRVGNRPPYGDLMRQGCRATGRRTGPPGFESDEYDCPFPIAGSPAWFQGGKPKRETVFGGCGCSQPGVGSVEGALAIGGFLTVGALILAAYGLYTYFAVESHEYGGTVRREGERTMGRARGRRQSAERRAGGMLPVDWMAEDVDPYEGKRGAFR
jgi:hypothetical protein